MKEVINKGVIVFHVDDILINTSKFKYDYIRWNWSRFLQHAKNKGPLSGDNLAKRDKKSLIDWLIKDTFNQTSRDIISNTMRAATSLGKITNHKRYPSVTKMGIGTLQNKFFLTSELFVKAYIIIYDDDEYLAKKNIIEKEFKNYKITILKVPVGEDIFLTLEKNDINWNVYIDNDISRVRSLVEKTPMSNREFLIPKCGYFTIPIELDILLKEKGFVYTYYGSVQ